MAVRVAINGFGRIGRLVYRAALESGRTDVEFVAINDLGPVATSAHLLQYDSVHGTLPGRIETGEDWMDAGRGRVKVLSERDPARLPWDDLDIDVVMECTGLFASREKAGAHLAAGAKKVLVSAPASGADLTVVYGVNDDRLEAGHTVVSNASCTTNCLAPVAHVLNHDAIGIERGFMTTIHSLSPATSRRWIRCTRTSTAGRAAAMSMIPTSTGAAKARWAWSCRS